MSDILSCYTDKYVLAIGRLERKKGSPLQKQVVEVKIGRKIRPM
jgi:hypothetical protein